MDDEELIGRCRGGDLEAFNALVAAYQDRVFNLCLGWLGSPQAAEDATQEAFLSAYRNVARMRGPSVRPWLFRIAANACIDELRRRKRQGQPPLHGAVRGGDDERPVEVADPAPGPEQFALRGELRRAIGVELGRLPPDQRLAVV